MTFLIAAILFRGLNHTFAAHLNAQFSLIIDRRLSKQHFLGVEEQIGNSVGR